MYKDFKNLLSEAKFYEGYSRYDDRSGRYESWGDSVTRVMDMHRGYYNKYFSPELEMFIHEAEQSYLSKLVLGAQRALQFGGEQLLKHQDRKSTRLNSSH